MSFLYIVLFPIFGLFQTVQDIVIDSHNESISILTNTDPPKVDKLSVTLIVEPKKIVSDQFIVITGDELKAIATIQDYQRCNETTLTTHWSTKDGPIQTSPANASTIQYKFTKSDNQTFIKVDVFCNNTNTTLSGSAQVDLVAIDRVVVGDPVGKLFLEHGDLLNVKLVYTGTGPFKYCYRFCAPFDFIPCDICLWTHQTDDKEIPLSRYLGTVGNYTLMFFIENIANSETRHFTIKIIDTIREKTLPFAPIVSSILAVLILVTGVALHLNFRKIEYAETADFDFINHGQEEEDWEEELSFIQRVRNLFFRENQEESSLITGNTHNRTH